MASVAVKHAGSLHVRSLATQSSALKDQKLPSSLTLSVVRPGASRKQASRLQARGWGLPLNRLRVAQKEGCRRAVVSCDAGKVHKAEQTSEKRTPGGFRLQSVAWLPLVLAMAHETLTGEIHVDPSMDFYTNWHISEAFIKHFYVAFICCFSFGCVYFGSLKDPFYEGPESGYREDGGNGTAHWFYDVKEEEEEASREQLAKQVLALEMAQKEDVVRQLEEQLTSKSEPKETVKSL